MELYEAPLAETVEQLPSHELTVNDYLGELRKRTEAIEPEVQSLVDEPDWERLESRAADIDDDLPLYGVPGAVKDIFHVDGYVMGVRRRSKRARVREYQELFTTETKETMTEEGIDPWACPPALGTAPKEIGSTGDACMNMPWTLAGMPAVSLPGGAVDGLPVGLQMIADTGEDEHLLEWAEKIAPVVADTV